MSPHFYPTSSLQERGAHVSPAALVAQTLAYRDVYLLVALVVPVLALGLVVRGTTRTAPAPQTAPA